MSRTTVLLNILLLVLGFGFVIFWHELGHFLAAKWVGIRVEQFAVGFGQALLSWRKGIGVRVGTTRPEYEKRIDEHLAPRNGRRRARRESNSRRASTPRPTSSASARPSTA